MKSWLIFFALVSTLLATGSAQTVVYSKTGDTVLLKPPSPPTSPITSLLWKHNRNLAVEWEGPEPHIDYYSHFNDSRTSLDPSDGELSLTVSDEFAGEYTIEINGHLLPGSISLNILPQVPKPTVSVSCNEEKTKCTLFCGGDETDMTPKLAYIWKFNNTEHRLQSLDITPDYTAPEFVCMLQNPVSKESSEPFANPFTSPSPSPEGGGPKIYNALLVFLCLFGVVIVAVVVHRFKSGMWFFQKDSMPWEADFWQKSQTQADPEAPPANPQPGERNAMMESTS